MRKEEFKRVKGREEGERERGWRRSEKGRV